MTVISRKTFLKALPAAAAAASLAIAPGKLFGRGRRSGSECTHHHPHHIGKGLLNHPDARPGITAKDVIPEAQLRTEQNAEEVIELYNGIREIPEVADAIACYCGCMLPPMNKRSLLSCYEFTGMARGCAICQGTARLVIGRVKEGQALDRIRAAVDARYS